MEEDGEDWTPFWVQNNTDRLRHRVSSIFFSSGLLLTLLLLTAVFFIVFVVPSTITLTTQIFKPNSVKKSWDSINIVLVLFALVFGFLSRNMNEDSSNSTRFDEFRSRNQIKRSLSSSSITTPRWYPNEGRKSNPSTPHSAGGLRRTYSSYPDLSGFYTDDPWRFYDDTRVDIYRRSDSGGRGGYLHRPGSWKEVEELSQQQVEIKNVVQVETVVDPAKEVAYVPPPYSYPPPPPSPPSPSPPPAEPKETYQSVVRKKERRIKRKENEVEENIPIEPPMTPPAPLPLPPSPPSAPPPEIYQSVARKRERRRKRKENIVEENKPIESPRTPPPPPPPPPTEQPKRKSDKKRSGGSATKEFLNSFYHKKKKKQRQRSVENFDALIHQSQPPELHFQLPPPSSLPPPPPPPPPPPSVFHNFFTSKKDKRKRTQTITIQGPIPTPAPQPIREARVPKPTSQIGTTSSTTRKPSKPMKIRSFKSVDENTNSGGESPFRSIPPPPPPPPPFYKPAWKFAVQGDYVRVDSISSSQQSDSPDPSDVESDATPTAAAAGFGGATLFPPSPLFCPSPDVNTKAERFISRFRAGLKLEKIDSTKKHELGLSKLGPNISPRNL